MIFSQAVKSTTRHAPLKTIFGMVAALFLELAERIRAATIPNIVYRTSKKMACPCSSKPNCYPQD